MKDIFSPLELKNITLPNRVVRAATFENMSDENGNPTDKHFEMYREMAENDCGTIITGFNYTSQEGRAMQPFQTGIDTEEKIESWSRILEKLKKINNDTKYIIQISHTGRQTLKKITGHKVKGAGRIPCTYFMSLVEPLSEWEVDEKVEEYTQCAANAKKAGFHGVEIHGAHGYLIHQFLSPYTNRRKDKWGQDRLLFLKNILNSIVNEVKIPVFLKLSGADDRSQGLNLPLMESYVKEIDNLGIDLIEVSYGMMEIAFNIIRGEHPIDTVLKHNLLFKDYPAPLKKLFKKFIYPLFYKKDFLPYEEIYNLKNGLAIKNICKKTSVIVTGGIRNGEQIRYALRKGFDGVSLSRPFIIEPDLMKKLKENPNYNSKCINCNLCTVMSDSKFPMQCYSRGKIFK